MVVVGLEQAKGMEEKEMERRRGEIDDGAGCEEAVSIVILEGSLGFYILEYVCTIVGTN